MREGARDWADHDCRHSSDRQVSGETGIMT